MGGRAMPGVLTGGVDEGNRGSADWGPQGLVAFGSHSSVVVLDPRSATIIQTLQGHKTTVTRVKWRRCGGELRESEAVLSSGDGSGMVIVWDVSAGLERRRVGERGAVVELAWLSPASLLVLSPQSTLSLWNASTGELIWRKSYSESFHAMDLDPFAANNVGMLTTSGNLMLVTDIREGGEPSGEGRVLGIPGSNWGREERGKERSPGVLSRGVAQLIGAVANTDRGKTPTERVRVGEEAVRTEQCMGLRYSPGARNVLYLLWSRQVLLLDTAALQTIAHVLLDNNISPFFQNGKQYSSFKNTGASLSASTPSNPSTTTMKVGPPFLSQLCTLRLHTLKPVHDHDESVNKVDVSLEAVCSSDSLRVSKSYRLAAVALDPVTQSSLCLLMTTGRVLVYSLAGEAPGTSEWGPLSGLVGLDGNLGMEPVGRLRLVMSGLVSGLGGTGTVVRWRPTPDAQEEDGDKRGDWAAVGTAEGGIQLVRVDEGRVERDWAVHGAPVRRLEWGGPQHIISAAFTPTLSTSTVVRNELVITDIRTGLSKTLRPDAEESAISLISVSHYYTYLAISFNNQPMEIWHLKEMRLLRRMSKACPVIIDMAWSGKHHQAHIVKSGGGEEPDAARIPDIASITGGKEREQTVYKENLVVLDNENHLYHVVVKGMHVRDGKEVNTQWSTAASINAMVWKGDLLAFGDSEGRISVWDLGAKQSRISGGPSRAPVKQMQFSPYAGDLTLAVLHTDGVSIWNAGTLSCVEQLRTGYEGLGATQVVDVHVGPGGAPLLLTSDGALRLFDPSLSVQSSPISHGRLCSLFAPTLLPASFLPAVAVFLRDPTVSTLYHESGGICQALEASEMRRGEKELLSSQLAVWRRDSPDMDKTMRDASIPERALHAALLRGCEWEIDFWRVVSSVLDPSSSPLPPSLDMAWPNSCFKRSEKLRSGVLSEGEEAESGDKTEGGRVERLIAAGETEAAVGLLLSSNATYQDSLFACLLSALTAGGASAEPKTQSTVKLVATGLIASGRHKEGTQLLCLIGKSKDAARYLQSNGQWQKAAWLAKEEEAKEVLLKWAEYLCSPSVNNKRRGLALYARCGEWERVVEILAGEKLAAVAAVLLPALPQGSVGAEVAGSVEADYARELESLGLYRAGLAYAQSAGPNGLPISHRIALRLKDPPS